LVRNRKEENMLTIPIIINLWKIFRNYLSNETWRNTEMPCSNIVMVMHVRFNFIMSGRSVIKLYKRLKKKF